MKGQKHQMLAVAMLLLMTASCGNHEQKAEDSVVRVQAEVIQPSVEINGIDYVGEVEEESSTPVSFTGSGTLLRVAVTDGQRVSKGQLIAEMDATQCRNALSAAEAMLRQAKDVEARMRQLHDSNSLPDMKWIETQSHVQQAEAQVQMAQKALADCRIAAPCSGVVSSRMCEPGMTVLPAQPICKILDIDKVKVKIAVPEKSITHMADHAVITVDALDGASFTSSGIEKGVKADAISRTYEVRYIINNTLKNLLPGMVCNVSPINDNDSIKTITVPITTVQRSADGKMFVWKVEDGKAQRAEVTLGKSSGDRIAVTNGLSANDVIVIQGYQKLSENTKVVY